MDHTNINDYVYHWQSKWFEPTIDKWKLGRVIMAYIFVNNMWALWKMRESFGRILKYSSNFLPHFWKTQCPHNPCSLCFWSYLTDTRQAWGGKVREEMDESLRPVKWSPPSITQWALEGPISAVCHFLSLSESSWACCLICWYIPEKIHFRNKIWDLTYESYARACRYELP